MRSDFWMDGSKTNLTLLFTYTVCRKLKNTRAALAHVCVCMEAQNEHIANY